MVTPPAARLQHGANPDPVPGGDTKTRSRCPVSSSTPTQQHGTGKDGALSPRYFLGEGAGHSPQIWPGSGDGAARGGFGHDETK